MDHSQNYKRLKLKNLPHKKRLRKIREEVKRHCHSNKVENYADFGCSNGYITKLLKDDNAIPNVEGYDFNEDNLKKATKEYPDITFGYFDLNNFVVPEKKYDLVTSFETLEHVGILDKAMDNLIARTRDNGLCLITVPIEIGFWGVLKFVFKIFFYGYSMQDMGHVSKSQYLWALLTGKRISEFRSDGRPGWSTHFGFDYRDIDDYLRRNQVNFTKFNQLTFRFYLISPENNK